MSTTSSSASTPPTTMSDSGVPHASAKPNTLIDTTHARNRHDEYDSNYTDDEDEGSDTSGFVKSLLDSELGGIEVVTYPRSGEYDFRHATPNAALSAISEFDKAGEFDDYKYTRGVLEEQGGECAEVAAISYGHELMVTEMPDGSGVIMKEFHNAYWKQRTGQAAFDGNKVSDQLKLEFMDAACAVSNNRPHLSEEEERNLNPDCYERFQEHATMWTGDYDEVPVRTKKVGVIVKLHRSGKNRTMFAEKMRVRNDMPKDPYLFSQAGIDAARTLHEYQADDEQIEHKKPIAYYERPQFEGGLILLDIPMERYRQFHENPGQNDPKIASVLASLNELRAHPEEFAWMDANCPDECAEGSGIFFNRRGFEADVIAGVWKSIDKQSKWTTKELYAKGRLEFEDDFGDNPEYLRAKLRWWEQVMGISGIEAVVRYHFERIRARRRPNTHKFFLSEEAEMELNIDSSDGIGCPSPDRTVPPEEQVFDDLHTAPVDYNAKPRFGVKNWYHEAQANLLPHNLFDDGESCRAAYDILLEYQDSQEPGTESHREIENWARPQYMHKHENFGLGTEAPPTVARPSPPGLNVSPAHVNENKAALAHVLNDNAAPCAVINISPPPGLEVSAAQQMRNQNALTGTLPDMPAPPPGLNIPSTQVEWNKKALGAVLCDIMVPDKANITYPPGLNVPSANRDHNKNALAAIPAAHRTPSPPGMRISPIQMEQNKDALAAIRADAPPPPGLATSPTTLTRNKNALAGFQSDASSRRSSRNTNLPPYYACGLVTHDHVNPYPKGKPAYEIAAPFDPDKAARDLMTLLRPKNDAENRLMALLKPGVDKFLSTSRPRTDQEERLLGLIQQRPAFVSV